MNWTELLTAELESAYASADGLMKLAEGQDLGWKPETGENWMTLGQLLRHLADACGASCKGFVTGDWGMPEGADFAEISPEEMLPSADRLPTIGSVAEARRWLAEDRTLALQMIARSGEEKLSSEPTTAPWDPQPMILGHRLLHMIKHLVLHKAQLFYYLKLLGMPVNTGHLWGD